MTTNVNELVKLVCPICGKPNTSEECNHTQHKFGITLKKEYEKELEVRSVTTEENLEQETKKLKNLVNVSKNEGNEELKTTFGSIRSKFNTKLPDSSIFAIVQGNPCLVKCINEIRNKNNKDIDSFYLARHDWIKKKIIDAIY